MTGAQFATVVMWLGGLFFVVFGAWAFVAPHSFYDQLATFPPYNRHLVHDIGAFQIGIGAALLMAARWNDAPFVVLAGAAAGGVVHLVSHIIDHDLGGSDSDIPLFAVIAAILLSAAATRWVAAVRRAP